MITTKIRLSRFISKTKIVSTSSIRGTHKKSAVLLVSRSNKVFGVT